MKKYLTILITCCLTTNLLAITEPVTFDFGQIKDQNNNPEIALSTKLPETVALSADLSLEAFSYLIEIGKLGSISDIEIEFSVQSKSQINFEPDQPTSSEGAYSKIDQITPIAEQFGRSPIYLGDELTIDSRRFAKIIVFPTFLNDEEQLTTLDQLSISFDGELLTQAQLLNPSEIFANNSKQLTPASPLTGSVNYLIVTNRALAAAFVELKNYKAAIGFTTELVLIEDILNSYSGRDEAEQLREYLKEYYAQGGQYVLLGGDETILPIRYAYHYRTSAEPTLEQLQVADLYFADIDGDWNADGDDVWGERYDDEADLTPELLVGRLPIHDSSEVANYTKKLISYETDPGGGGLDWLTKTFFFSSDQMRDYTGVGQHNIVAEAFPNWFDVDLVSGVEASFGDDISPTNMTPTETTDKLTEGFGIVHIIAHGRSDGFIVKSSGYNQWPKSYLLTAPATSEHGSTELIGGHAGFYYSLACDNGGYDLERIHSYSSPALSRSLLGQAESGAIGFVAYSRWGWVSSSHYLQQAFFDSIFAHPNRPAIISMNEVKEQYSYLRDLVLGQNYLGDPSMKVYTETPEELIVTINRYEDQYEAYLTSNQAGVAGVKVLLSQDGSFIAEYLTDQNGRVTLGAITETLSEYQIAAIKTGHITNLGSYIPSIVTGVDDDQTDLPNSFELGQNYPNPFNPITNIEFSLESPTDLTLTIINVLGQAVATIAEGNYPAGTHKVVWNGLSDAGTPVTSGMYLYRLATDSRSTVKKMLLLK